MTSFISEKILSTDAVPTGIDRQISDKVLNGYLRLLSPSQFLNLVLISFISEKLLSTDAVPTGIDRQISD